MAWNDESVAKLKRLWAKNLSASAIAAEIGGDITRNAVLGKVHRLHLPQRDCDKQWPRGREDRKRGIKAKPRHITSIPRPKSPPSAFLFGKGPDIPPDPVPVSAEVVVPLRERKGIVDLADDDCRWPIGDPGTADFHFCNGKKIGGLPYCKVHSMRAYVPPDPRRKTEIREPATIPHRETADA